MRRDHEHMRVAFRTDAAIEIGTGHVMRCLTLATALTESGASCVFVCRAHEGHLIDFITSRGFAVVALPAKAGDRAQPPDPQAPPHAHWLGVHWSEDVDETRAALAAMDAPFDWLVVDHYGLDGAWEKALRPVCDRLMVIDDLADRTHDCDLLLDQGLGRTPADYAGLMPDGAITLMGPQSALLRPEFAALRDQSLRRRADPVLEHILVAMGGVDKDNATLPVLDALAGCALPPDVRVTVVMGRHAPWLEDVRARAARMPVATTVLTGVEDMAALMAQSDLAIGAGGMTTWERCALGVPTLQLALASNQRDITSATAASGAAVFARLEDLASTMSEFFESGELAGRLATMSRAGSRVTDGKGTPRVAQKLMEQKI